MPVAEYSKSFPDRLAVNPSFGTVIPAGILLLNQGETHGDALFIDASCGWHFAGKFAAAEKGFNHAEFGGEGRLVESEAVAEFADGGGAGFERAGLDLNHPGDRWVIGEMGVLVIFAPVLRLLAAGLFMGFSPYGTNRCEFLLIPPAGAPTEVLPTMGQQSKKIIKRRRRADYLKRKAAQAKLGGLVKKPAVKKAEVAKKAPAKKAAAKKAPAKKVAKKVAEETAVEAVAPEAVETAAVETTESAEG
jgi:hypothetical protein